MNDDQEPGRNVAIVMQYIFAMFIVCLPLAAMQWGNESVVNITKAVLAVIAVLAAMLFFA